MDLSSERIADFRAVRQILHLDRVPVWPTSFTPVPFRRTPRLVRAPDPDAVHLTLPLGGLLELGRGEQQVTYPPTSMCAVSTPRPIDAWASRNGRSCA